MVTCYLQPYRVKATVQILSEKAGYQIKMLNIPAIWEETQGEGVTIAVLDTGVPNHVDLPEISYPIGANQQDLNGHSTHCCGIIAAKVNNGIGMQGIAPKATVISVPVLGPDGAGGVDDIIDGIRYCISQRVDIINMSLGISTPFDIPELHAVIKKAHTEGITIICAAGNEAGPVDLPALYPETIAVAAVDMNKHRAYFSNVGRALDFAMPGVDIFSTYLNNSYAVLSGTSMASPMLAGVAALIKSKHRKNGVELTTEEIREHLTRIAIDLGLPGDDIFYGNGIPIFTGKSVQAPKALPWWRKLLNYFI